ncbi:MAG: DUF5104 domain-containing protein [Coriobacteriales bacterium]|jgi:hypothetical protein|nr:DUF5104 domain-containing protein [Coriobacteriales bacterium]
MTRKLILVPLLVVSLLLASCFTLPRTAVFTEGDAADYHLESIIEALKSNDRQKIRELFSKHVLNTVEDVDRGIDYLFELVEDEIVEVGKLTWGSSESVRYGKSVELVTAWCDFSTTADDYSLSMAIYDKDDYSSDNVGLYSLRVLAKDDNYPKHASLWDVKKQPGIYQPSSDEVARVAMANTDEYCRILIEHFEGAHVAQVRPYFLHEAVRGSFWFDLDYASVLYSEGALFAVVDVGMYPEYKKNGGAVVGEGAASHVVEVMHGEGRSYALLYDPASSPPDSVIAAFSEMNDLDDAMSYDAPAVPESFNLFLQDFYFCFGSNPVTEYEIMSLDVLGENPDARALLYIRQDGALLDGYPVEVSANELWSAERIWDEHEMRDWLPEYASDAQAASGGGNNNNNGDDGFLLALQYPKTFLRYSGQGAFPDNYEQAKEDIIATIERLQARYS